MADQPRLVAKYRGMQINDAREHIQVVISGEYPIGSRAWLKSAGFTRRNETTWEAPHNAMSIAAAQAIGSTFFSGEG